MKIANGSHHGSLTENCVMEHVALEYLRGQGIMSTKKLLALKTDAPGCTAPWITQSAQSVNDRLNDEDRQRLGALIPRLLHDARMPSDEEKARRVAVRVSIWVARSVLDQIIDEHDHETATRSIVTAEKWLRGEATKEECAAASSSSAAASAAASSSSAAASSAASAAAYASSSSSAAYAYASSSAAAAYAYAFAYAECDLVLWLDDLIDAHVKALAEEGLLGDDDAFETWAVESCPV